MSQNTFESEQRFRDMLGATRAKFAAISKDFVFLYANDAYAKQWDKQPEDLVGRHVKEILGVEGFEESLDRFGEAMEGQIVNYEAEYNVNHRVFVLAIRLVPFWETDQDSTDKTKIQGFYVLSQYVTSKRVSQQALSLILASAPGRICFIDPNYEITYANRQFHEEFNHEPELKGFNFAEVIGREMWKSIKPNIDRAFNGLFLKYPEVVGGEDCMVYLIPDQVKQPLNVLGVYCLIFPEAELGLGRQRLRNRARNVELALQGKMVGIWEIDPDRDDWLLTEHLEKILGLPAGNLENSRSMTLKRIHPDDLPDFLHNRRSFLRSGTMFVNEVRMKDSLGDYRWMRITGRSERDTDGKATYFAGTIEDINKLKTAELLAAEQVRRRDSFLSMLSHELRNPVAAIKYALDVFQQPAGKQIELPEDHRSSINIVTRQTNIISRLLKDLLNVNRISSNEILFEDAPVCLVKLVREIAKVSLHRFSEKKQQLIVECEIDGFQISGDEVRLHQVFVNLLDNASKYSPEQTIVKLSCKIDPDSGEFVAVVSDQGQGIDPESQQDIFELFFQEDTTLDRSMGGLGIGLYLVKRIVEAHHGKVSVVSPGTNGGSDFEVRLPCGQSNPNQTNIAAHCKIVLVEDNDDSRDALSLALAARDFDVQSFSDGETAALKLPLLSPNVALIDIGLPRMDGMTLMKKLRLREELKNTLFIALTGYGQDHEHEAIMASGFDHHLVKPLDLAVLIKIVAEQTRAT